MEKSKGRKDGLGVSCVWGGGGRRGKKAGRGREEEHTDLEWKKSESKQQPS